MAIGKVLIEVSPVAAEQLKKAFKQSSYNFKVEAYCDLEGSVFLEIVLGSRFQFANLIAILKASPYFESKSPFKATPFVTLNGQSILDNLRKDPKTSNIEEHVFDINESNNSYSEPNFVRLMQEPLQSAKMKQLQKVILDEALQKEIAQKTFSSEIKRVANLWKENIKRVLRRT